MKILVLNCGSSSLKYQLFDMDTETAVAKGNVEKIGLPDSFLTHQRPGADKVVVTQSAPDHAAAIRMMLDALLLHPEYGVIHDQSEIVAIGHRIVHGGPDFTKSCEVTDEVLAGMRKIIMMAPLHNPGAVLGIETARAQMPGLLNVVVFDTAFHQTMAPEAYIYGIPYEYFEKYKIRRYGAHGTSHRYVSIRCRELLGNPEHSKIVVCHIGSGSSLTAVLDGKVIDTSMGFHPQSGVLMGTRCGDLDPAILPYLAEREGWEPEEMATMINKKSGLLGISGVSSDMRDVQAAADQGNQRAALALQVLTHTVIHYIGAYVAELNGLDALVFTAGIGENAVEFRRDVCASLQYLGIELDQEANKQRGKETLISTPASRVPVYVIPTNEELMIARDTLAILNAKK